MIEEFKAGGKMTFREELEEVLEKEVMVLEELKNLTFQKTDLIINNEIQKLEATTKREENLLNQMANLEGEIVKLLDTWGLASNTLISEIIERIPEDKGNLEEIKDKMHHIMEELYLRNKLNDDLIHENLQWIDFNINLITDIHGHPSYGKDDKKPGGNSIFDRKV